jgi:hypothetical protein
MEDFAQFLGEINVVFRNCSSSCANISTKTVNLVVYVLY